MRFTYAVIILIIAGFSSFLTQEIRAQILDVKPYTVANGLPGSDISVIHQSSDGMMWMGIDGEGLVRFNGLYSRQYTRERGLKDDSVKVIFEDSENRLWLSTVSGGLAYLDSQEEIYYPYEGTALSDASVTDLHEDSNGQLWVSTQQSGVFVISNGQPIVVDGLGQTVQAIWENNEGLWVVGSDGVFLLSQADYSVIKSFSEFRGLTVFHHSNTPNEDLLLATSQGLLRISGSEVAEVSLAASVGTIKSAHETKLGNLILISEQRGLLFHDYQTFLPIGKHSGLASEKVDGVFLDSDQRYWVWTRGHGVDLIRNPAVIRYDSNTILPSDEVLSVHTRKESTLVWLGTSRGLIGINDDPRAILEVVHTPVKTHIKDISSFKDDSLLLLTKDNSLIHYKKRGSFEEWWPIGNVFQDKRITDIYVSENQQIYIGTDSGLAVFDDMKSSPTIYQRADGLAGNYIVHISEDQSGRILVGSDKGFSIINDGIIRSPEDLNLNRFQSQVRYTLAGPDGHYWLGTNQGIVRYDPMSGDTNIFNNSDGLISVNTQSMVFSDSGDLWHATSSGVHKLRFTGDSLDYVWHYGFQESRLGMETNRQAAVTNHGTLWFGTNKGVVSYSNQFENPVNDGPEVSIQDISVDFLRRDDRSSKASLELNESIGTEKVSRLNQTENSLTFQFIGLDYSAPEEVEYQYRLLGLSEKWSPLSKEKKVSYDNLNPGDYQFQVRAKNATGMMSPSTAGFRFEISTPFWKSYWFYGILIVSLFGLVIGGDRLRLQRIEQKKLKQLVDERTDNLRATLEEREVLIKEVHHRIKNNLAVISSMLELQRGQLENESPDHVLQEAQMRVKSIALIHEKLYQNETLAEIDFQKYVDDLVAMISESYNVDNKQIDIETDVESIRIGLDQSIPCGLILNELVSNAFEHAYRGRESGQLNVKFTNGNGNQVRFEVNDDGPGIPDEILDGYSSTLGMTLVYTLVEQLKGSLDVDTSAGSQFVITFEKEKV
jgi:two-component sensor histidine kinase/ligand-binding sensor domain-containing protein